MSSTTASGIALTPTQQMTEAAERARERLLEATNVKLLQVALLQIAAEAVASDPAFADLVRRRYLEIAPPPKKIARGGTRKASAVPKVSDYVESLTPIKHVPNLEVSLEAPPDPYFLLDVFGAHQLERALKPRSVADLRKAAAIVEQRHPGTMPKGKVTKPGWIAYIVQYVAGTEAAVRPTPW